MEPVVFTTISPFLVPVFLIPIPLVCKMGGMIPVIALSRESIFVIAMLQTVNFLAIFTPATDTVWKMTMLAEGA